MTDLQKQKRALFMGLSSVVLGVGSVATSITILLNNFSGQLPAFEECYIEAADHMKPDTSGNRVFQNCFDNAFGLTTGSISLVSMIITLSGALGLTFFIASSCGLFLGREIKYQTPKCLLVLMGAFLIFQLTEHPLQMAVGILFYKLTQNSSNYQKFLNDTSAIFGNDALSITEKYKRTHDLFHLTTIPEYFNKLLFIQFISGACLGISGFLTLLLALFQWRSEKKELNIQSGPLLAAYRDPQNSKSCCPCF